MIDAIDVPLINCTRKPTVGGIAMRKACDRMTWRSSAAGASGIAAAASHCCRGIAWIAPRQISPRNAAAYIVKARVTAGHGSMRRPVSTARP